MIRTSSHKEWQTDMYLTYAISGNRGKDANYKGRCYPKLAPKNSFWKLWHDNIGKISDEENNRFYVEQYYKQVLLSLDPEEVFDDLNNAILLCYESSSEFCHRHIVAAWLELLLDIEVPEINLAMQKFERPTYIKEYLEEVMKNSINMRGFNSLRALYLFEKSEKLENLANKLEANTDKCYDSYRQAACYLRCDADEAEAKYNQNIKETKLIKVLKK